METFFSVMDILIGLGMIALAIATIGLLYGIVVRRVPRLIDDHVLLIAAVLAFVAALGTLYYSEIVGVLPCKLCWYQRALLYPQVLIFAYAYFKKDPLMFLFTMFVSAAGLAVAVYHVMLPLFTNPLFCDQATGLCLVQSVRVFGVITIPMMSATVFAALLALSILGYKNHRERTRSSNAAIVA